METLQSVKSPLNGHVDMSETEVKTEEIVLLDEENFVIL